MPDPSVAGIPTSTGPSSGPELINGHFHVISKKDHPTTDALAKLAGIDSLCLIILDLLMPVMDGWDFVVKLRQQTGFALVPVVVHTSAAGQAPAGVTRVLQKPLLFDRLLSVVREFCAQ